jgi:hypothetical protein
MKWFIPTWNGDLRLEPAAEGKTLLTVLEPTAAEKEDLVRLGQALEREGWLESAWRKRWGKKVEVTLNASLEKVGPLATEVLRHGPAVLTAVTFQGGRVETTTGPREELEKLAAAPGGEAAATVKRPTPCCPRCIPGAVEPATEALLAFLTPEQHESWARQRVIPVVGGLSGHEYLLGHRHGALARRHGRICIDLDDNVVLHFHDWTVPPEEEVLAAKLILEHREPWLRNEATLWDHPEEVTDGRPDAVFTQMLGELLMADARSRVQ